MNLTKIKKKYEMNIKKKKLWIDDYIIYCPLYSFKIVLTTFTVNNI